MLVGQAVDLLADPAGLVVLGVGHVAHDGLALAGVGPQVLGPPPGVTGDDGVGGGQDVLCGAVILFQQNGCRIGIVTFEILDIADRGAPECVDRLIGVADDT